MSFQKIFRVHRDSEIDTFLGIADRGQAEKEYTTIEQFEGIKIIWLYSFKNKNQKKKLPWKRVYFAKED